jgi:benzoyl-CoA-dihydrodiol lyase
MVVAGDWDGDGVETPAAFSPWRAEFTVYHGSSGSPWRSHGSCAGGGYELAMACDEIVLVDDGNSAVSLPETPLLAVLPGTGGLTRLVDKRKVRRDLADLFCTTAEGVKGKRAVSWRLVDALAPKSRFPDEVRKRAEALAAESAPRSTDGISLPPLDKRVEENRIEYSAVVLEMDRGEPGDLYFGVNRIVGQYVVGDPQNKVNAGGWVIEIAVIV